jgi:hypothetical protein
VWGRALPRAELSSADAETIVRAALSKQTMARRIFTSLSLRAVTFLRLNHFAAAQTGSADAYVLGSGSHPGVNRAQIDVPAPLTHVVRVADRISELRPLAADITNSCHNSEILPGLLPKPRFYRNSANFAKAEKARRLGGCGKTVPPQKV